MVIILLLVHYKTEFRKVNMAKKVFILNNRIMRTDQHYSIDNQILAVLNKMENHYFKFIRLKYMKNQNLILILHNSNWLMIYIISYFKTNYKMGKKMSRKKKIFSKITNSNFCKSRIFLVKNSSKTNLLLIVNSSKSKLY